MIARSRRRRPAVGATLAAVVSALVLVACGRPSPTTTPPIGSASETAPPTTAPTSAAPTTPASGAPTTTTPSPTAPAGSGGATVIVDPGLLDVLPSSVAGVSVAADADTAAEIAADPSLTANVDALALAAAFGPLATDDAAGDYAVATVVHLRPGTFSDGFFRAWRDTFDAGVCEQAGGVDGHAQAELGGRTVWIGTCAGGVHTYHAVIRDESVIVSLQSAGPGRFGEQMMAGLTE